jgi:hypothetical protein
MTCIATAMYRDSENLEKHFINVAQPSSYDVECTPVLNVLLYFHIIIVTHLLYLLYFAKPLPSPYPPPFYHVAASNSYVEKSY